MKWVKCSEKYPDMELTYESSFNNSYKSDPVLIQTKRGELFVAICKKCIYKNKCYKDRYEWFSYGTGGRRMKVMSGVIAWQYIEPFKE